MIAELRWLFVDYVRSVAGKCPFVAMVPPSREATTYHYEDEQVLALPDLLELLYLEGQCCMTRHGSSGNGTCEIRQGLSMPVNKRRHSPRMECRLEVERPTMTSCAACPATCFNEAIAGCFETRHKISRVRYCGGLIHACRSHGGTAAVYFHIQ